MWIDSHCHLDRVDLGPYGGSFARFMAETRGSGVGHLLCASIDLAQYPAMRALVDPYPQVFVSVGVHPNEPPDSDPEIEALVDRAMGDPRVVAIGETGLDFFRCETGERAYQVPRFRTHIAAAKRTGKPLIIHTRAARTETLDILREEGAGDVGGVIHCFTDDWDMARQALDLGFSISFSGILTFKNAAALRAVAARVPLDRLLIETDSPYLAPVPHRGRSNEPKYVSFVGRCIAELRGVKVEAVLQATGANFFRLFGDRSHARGSDQDPRPSAL